VPFEEVFATVEAREEAIAVFLALLELIKRGVVLVEEGQPPSRGIVLRLVAGVGRGQGSDTRVAEASASAFVERLPRSRRSSSVSAPQPIGFGLNDTVAVAEVEAPDAVLTQLVDL
jgi:hypothetical protein